MSEVANSHWVRARMCYGTHGMIHSCVLWHTCEYDLFVCVIARISRFIHMCYGTHVTIQSYVLMGYGTHGMIHSCVLWHTCEYDSFICYMARI